MNIDVYPTGVLATLIGLRRAYTPSIARQVAPEDRAKMRAWARARLHHELHGVASRVRARQWRPAKNMFNGYMAEPVPFPEGLRRCGTGWTRRRALRSLQRHARRPGVRWETINQLVERELR